MTETASPYPARRRVGLWLTLGLTAAMVAGIVGLAMATGWEESLASLRALTLAQLGVLLALSASNYALRGLRWHLYVRVLRIPLSLWQTFLHYIAGFAMTVTPGRLGEVIRLRWIWQEAGTPPERSAPLVVVDRAADLAVIGLLIGASVAFSTIGLAAGLPVAGFCLAMAVIATRATLLSSMLRFGWQVLGRWPRLFVRARRAALALRPFSDWPVVLPALALGGVGWLAEGISFWLLLDWMGAEVPLWTAIGIFLIATVTGGATGAPGGIGGAEAAMVALLSLQGVPLSVSLPATAVIRLTTLWFAIAIGLGALPFALRAARRGTHAAQS
ncbi:flippase-like domain-containing protein [Halovulum dunhuangense]|uniref:Flippase-like domain-containing protein n=1 Tax=Halovulum dunhuangense TaxID=1505036 RepID=A0A849L4X4_9RHOB|nr:lysylphosphatidylglycerol synthase transmembrane domain-containing protein [Halovulum dunhuangense]NNU81234.1 flippase-like domain-containing protein [Halovulum dunhuangense]